MDHAGRPNIILINCDDLGYGDLGCYGSRVNDTPALDALADEGVRFTDFYMASPVCSPSRGAMLTGCYPSRIGFGDFDGEWVLFPGQGVGLNPSEITIASLLRQRGYATSIVGKWHCGDQPEFLPTRHGFDEYFGIPYSNDMGRQVGQRPWPPLPLLRNEQVIEAQFDQAGLTERYVEQAVRFIRSNADGPFFLYFAHMYVHLPIYVPPRFLKDSRNGPYGGAVSCVDWSVAVLRHELRRLGLEQDTLIVFTSDNGARGDHGGSNGPLRGRKGTTWDGGQRVPCIMCWPGTLKAGACSHVVSSLDFYRTFAALAGAPVPTDRVIDGRNILPLMRDPGGRHDEHPFFYNHRNRLDAVRLGPWKLHLCRKEGPAPASACRELYNLVEDVGETVNVYDAHPDVVRRLEALAEDFRRDVGDDFTNTAGRNVRPIGRVATPRPLTEYDPQCPYMWAEYDLGDRG